MQERKTFEFGAAEWALYNKDKAELIQQFETLYKENAKKILDEYVNFTVKARTIEVKTDLYDIFHTYQKIIMDILWFSLISTGNQNEIVAYLNRLTERLQLMLPDGMLIRKILLHHTQQILIKIQSAISPDIKENNPRDVCKRFLNFYMGLLFELMQENCDGLFDYIIKKQKLDLT